MDSRKIDDLVARSLDALDGNRVAIPLLQLHEQRMVARGNGLEAYAEAEKQLSELKEAIASLDASLEELEKEIVQLAQERASEKKEFEFARFEMNGKWDIDALRSMIMDKAGKIASEVREASAAMPGPDISIESLQPGFAANAIDAAPSNTASAIAPNLAATTGVGPDAATSAIKSFLGQLGVSDSDDLADDASNEKAVKSFMDRMKGQEVRGQGHEDLLRGMYDKMKESMGSDFDLPASYTDFHGKFEDVRKSIKNGETEMQDAAVGAILDLAKEMGPRKSKNSKKTSDK